MNADERRATAYHEAGHAVMGFIFDRVPTSVDIIHDKDGNTGHTYFGDDAPNSFKRYLDTSPEKQRYLEMRVLVALAGTAAHDLMCPGREHDCGDLRDEKRAKALIGESMSWDDDHDAALSRLKITARKNIAGNWSKVEALASMLMRRCKISASEIRSLLLVG